MGELRGVDRPAVGAAAGGEMARILVVDDEELDRVLIRSILEPEGHHLLFAGDGQAAQKTCRETEVDVVITDLAMPRVNGLRLIRELREDHFDMPIIAVSGWAPDQLDLAEDYGANLTLFKPLDGEKLRAAVRRVFHPRRPPPPVDLWG